MPFFSEIIIKKEENQFLPKALFMMFSSGFVRAVTIKRVKVDRGSAITSASTNAHLLCPKMEFTPKSAFATPKDFASLKWQNRSQKDEVKNPTIILTIAAGFVILLLKSPNMKLGKNIDAQSAKNIAVDLAIIAGAFWNL